jgi:adenine-specific DNA methylase
MKKISYFNQVLPSKGHTAIYKIHKYFARRPHNQFRAMIEHYVPENGVVLDCFAGGGVTLVEGLTSNRRVVSLDLNSIASLVQQAQVVEVPAERINEVTSQLALEIRELVGEWFETTCRHCEESTSYRWIERAYVVSCPTCSEDVLLSENNKFLQNNGKIKNGTYKCTSGSHPFESVSTVRNSSRILNVRYKCASCGIEETASPTEEDIALSEHVQELESSFLKKHNLSVPSEEIPMDWDRQSEDALRRKGFVTFADLFTVRNRIFIAMLMKGISAKRPKLSYEDYIGALAQISALIRYVNSMTFSTSSWMDGRPVAWAKHAYWTPNQYIEVNPFEYLAHRQLATTKWETDRVSRFTNKIRSENPNDVVNGSADYSIVCGDSRRIEIPADSVDAVITDPPFGGNVQYGELTHLWQVWLRDANPFEKGLFELKPEILVHRKRKAQSKTPKHYEDGLREVFTECHRVLKQDGVLAFTFNNKSAEAWFSVMNAAFAAGFSLEDSGVHYHEEIVAYRDTAHLRYDGELQGDVLYTFRKSASSMNGPLEQNRNEWLKSYIQKADMNLNLKEQAVALHLEIIRNAAKSIGAGHTQDEAVAWLNLLSIISKSNKSGESVLTTCKGLLNDN